jgi:hypothetical protein
MDTRLPLNSLERLGTGLVKAWGSVVMIGTLFGNHMLLTVQA